MKIVTFAVLFASSLFFSFAYATPPTKPPVFLKLNATVNVGGKEYPFDFSWTRKNIEGSSFDRGHYSDWVSSDRNMLRILDRQFAVIFSLPNDLQLQEARYRPSVFLLERANPTFLRSYPALGVGVKTDGFFALTHFKISSFARPVEALPMTKEELALMAQVEKREYAYLSGMTFRKSQWSQSKDLTRKLSGFRDFELLGKRAPWGQETPPVWTAFVAFNSGIAMDMEPYLFGFEQKEDSWVPLKYAGVYWCRAGLTKEKGPIRVRYDAHNFDQQQNEMLFDGVTQKLTIIWNLPVNFHPDN